MVLQSGFDGASFAEAASAAAPAFARHAARCVDGREADWRDKVAALDLIEELATSACCRDATRLLATPLAAALRRVRYTKVRAVRDAAHRALTALDALHATAHVALRAREAPAPARPSSAPCERHQVEHASPASATGGKPSPQLARCSFTSARRRQPLAADVAHDASNDSTDDHDKILATATWASTLRLVHANRLDEAFQRALAHDTPPAVLWRLLDAVPPDVGLVKLDKTATRPKLLVRLAQALVSAPDVHAEQLLAWLTSDLNDVARALLPSPCLTAVVRRASMLAAEPCDRGVLASALLFMLTRQCTSKPFARVENGDAERRQLLLHTQTTVC